MTPIYIRSVPDTRPHCIRYLERKIPYATIVYDEGGGIYGTFIKSLNMAGNKASLQMEDDVILTNGFSRKSQRVIDANPNTVIQFYSIREVDKELGTRLMPSYTYLMLQCTYMPEGFGAGLVEFYKEWDLEKYPTGIDNMVAGYLTKLKQQYLLHVPSLVQHRIEPSLFKGRSKFRTSPTFKLT